MAVDVTYCRPVSHDRAWFADPLKLLSGRIDPPAFNLRNEAMVAKHVHATVITGLHRSALDRGRTEAERDEIRDVLARCLPSRVSPYLFEGREVRSAPFDLSALRDLVQRNSQDLTAGVQRVFGLGWPQSDADVTAAAVLCAHVESFADNLKAVVTRLHRRLRWAMEQIRRLNVRRERQGTLDPEDEALFRRCDRLVKRLKGTAQRSRSQAEGHDDFNTFNVLAAEGFLPGYGLEVGSVVGWAEIPFWRTGAMDFSLPRPPATALREYVPGNLHLCQRPSLRGPPLSSRARRGALRDAVLRSLHREAGGGTKPSRRVDAVLWDPMPGGSGLLDQLCERFGEIVPAALEVVESCPAVCGSSCIDCLQTFRNAYYHRFLERAVAKERIEEWGRSLSADHDIPPLQPAASPSENAVPVNDAEVKLRRLLLAAGFGEGVRGEQIRLDRSLGTERAREASGTTTPDVIYRTEDHDSDEGVCIYLDGLSAHLHGNPETAERDREIRTWLRNRGYEVIEIAANELDDEDAMVRHFRRLASYLGMRAVRSRVRDDRSWFHERAGASVQSVRRLLRLVTPPDTGRYVNCVPLVPLRAAAGAFGDPHAIPDESEWDWVEIDTARSLRPGMFVAQVVGKSMEPRVPDGAYCLFASPVTGTRQDRTVLVQLRDAVDPDTGERFTVKRYRSEKTADEDGWRHVRIVLEPVNPEFAPIELKTEDEGSVAVVAELVEVIGSEPSA